MPAAPHRYDRPGNFPIFQENSQFKPYLQRFRYTNHMGKTAKGRIVARYMASMQIASEIVANSALMDEDNLNLRTYSVLSFAYALAELREFY